MWSTIFIPFPLWSLFPFWCPFTLPQSRGVSDFRPNGEERDISSSTQDQDTSLCPLLNPGSLPSGRSDSPVDYHTYYSGISLVFGSRCPKEVLVKTSYNGRYTGTSLSPPFRRLQPLQGIVCED